MRLADAEDIAQIFGEEDNHNIFCVGHTREQRAPGLPQLRKAGSALSPGIFLFGTTGSGKSFLARMILAGLIHAGQTATLIFDMHNEYGPDSISSDTNQAVPGLKGSLVLRCA